MSGYILAKSISIDGNEFPRHRHCWWSQMNDNDQIAPFAVLVIENHRSTRAEEQQQQRRPQLRKRVTQNERTNYQIANGRGGGGGEMTEENQKRNAERREKRGKKKVKTEQTGHLIEMLQSSVSCFPLPAIPCISRQSERCHHGLAHGKRFVILSFN